MIRTSVVLAVCLLWAGCFAGEPAKFANAECSNIKACPAGEVCKSLKCYSQCKNALDCGDAQACISGLCESYAPDCAADAACVDGFYCRAGTCKKKQDFGAICENNQWCLSGHCVDNVCCDSACESTCLSCSYRGNGQFDGSCLAVPAGEDPRQSCEGDASCDGQGACDIRPSGEQCLEDFQCSTGFCVDGVCCGTACEGTCLACAQSATGVTNGVCAAVALGQDIRESCVGNTACNGVGACFAKAQAAACEHDYECGSGHCKSGVCCNTGCEGACQACTAALTGQATGECSAVNAGLNPSEGCGGSLACDGNGACFAKGAGEECSAAYECSSNFCVDGVCCASACGGTCQTCNGAQPGECSALTLAEDIGKCDGATTATGCASTPCACDAAATCKPSGAIACSSGGQCASGVCLDGTCCASACAGGCLSCSSAQTGGSPGACLPVTTGKDPRDVCTGTVACNGAGACFDGALGSACSQNYACTSGYCRDGVCCDDTCSGSCRVCDGAGTSTPAANKGTCTYVSDGQDPDNECSGGASCNGGGGCYSRSPGETCAENYQCASGACCGGNCTYGFATMASPTSQNLNAVWAASTTSAFAVGDGGTIIMWDGTSWSLVAPSPTSQKLLAVHGISSSNVVAVGENGTVVRFNGSAWTSIPGATGTIRAVAVLSTSEFYIGAETKVRRYLSSSFSDLFTAPSGNIVSLLVSGTAVYAASRVFSGTPCGNVFMKTATGWDDLGAPGGCPTSLTMFGGSLYVATKQIVLRRTANTWTYVFGQQSSPPYVIPNYSNITSVSSSTSRLFAAHAPSGFSTQSFPGLVAVHSGQALGGETQYLAPATSVSGVDACSAFAVGVQGAVFRY